MAVTMDLFQTQSADKLQFTLNGSVLCAQINELPYYVLKNISAGSPVL
jgi:hypothetical protein